MRLLHPYGYYLSQAKYASDILSKASITDNKTVSTPLEYNAKLTPLDGEPISNATRYRQLVRSMIYLIITRSDISHVMSMFSKFMDTSCSVHYVAILWILWYVKDTLYHGLLGSETLCLNVLEHQFVMLANHDQNVLVFVLDFLKVCLSVK